MTISRLKTMICVFALATMVGAIASHLYNKTTRAGDAFVNSKSIRSLGDTLSKIHVNRSEYDQLMRIQGSAQHGEASSEADVRFVLAFLKAHGGTTMPDLIQQNMALGTLKSIVVTNNNTLKGDDKVTEPVKESIYETVVPFVTKNVAANTKNGKLGSSILILGQLKDKRAIPHLLPFANSPDKNIKIITRFALQDLGYNVLS